MTCLALSRRNVARPSSAWCVVNLGFDGLKPEAQTKEIASSPSLTLQASMHAIRRFMMDRTLFGFHVKAEQ